MTSTQISSAPTAQAPSLAGSEVERPLFVLGCARSGTSLLSRMIDAHPRIAIPYESHLYNTFYPWLRYYGDLSRRPAQERLLRDIFNTDVFRDWDPQPDLERTLTAIRRPDFHGVVDAILRTWAQGRGKARWGEKTPGHAFWWPQLLQGFPNLQLVHIVRDGRDVAVSWKRARFGPKHTLLLARQWQEYLQVIESFRAALPQDAFFQVRYEDLLADPEGVLRRLCRFLGEDYSPQMLAFYKGAADYRTDRSNLENLKKPLLAQNRDKWRKQMSARELRLFEAVAGRTLERYGYERALPQARLYPLEAFACRWIEHPPLKAWAMLKNTKGQIDAWRRTCIYLRLRLRLGPGLEKPSAG